MITSAFLLALVPLGIWLWLTLGQGGFWRLHVNDRQIAGRPVDAPWPSVVAVVPARNEADVMAASISGLIGQNYPGRFDIILVDDQSTDATQAQARAAATGADAERLHIIAGAPLPVGWVGKMWAVAQGVHAARALHPQAEYLLLTDADIGHRPDNLRLLVERAEQGGMDLVSQMVRLDTSTFAERLLIPAFVYFFAMLYPFVWVNDRGRKTAAAAGGSMLVRAESLKAAGGIEAIAGALIDDCALAAKIKSLPQPRGGLHLSLTDNAYSLRSYGGFAGVARMVARSAYTQLDYSPAKLAGTIFGMAFTFLVPVALAVWGGSAAVPAMLTYGLMVMSFGPILDSYRLSPLYALAVPLTALIYCGFTLTSAYNYARGRGGMWKGRVQAQSVPGDPGSDTAFDTASGKNSSTENFPVASHLISPPFRPAIHAYYRFARIADDISDSPVLSPEEKLKRLDRLDKALDGEFSEPATDDLRREAGALGIDLVHAHDLLKAFKQDAVKLRYRDWDDLMDYCTKSAMPVGRYVLAVHGEDPATFGPSDLLCAALQVINHLQDCGDDYRELDRVYLPLDLMEGQGVTPEALARNQCSPGLRMVLDQLLDRTEDLLRGSRALALMVRDRRLRMEVSVIQNVAERLVARLRRDDPLAIRVKLSKFDYFVCLCAGAGRGFSGPQQP